MDGPEGFPAAVVFCFIEFVNIRGVDPIVEVRRRLRSQRFPYVSRRTVDTEKALGSQNGCVRRYGTRPVERLQPDLMSGCVPID